MIPQTETPPADPTAIIGRRLLAYLIDGVILIVLLVALFASMASSNDLGSSFEAEVTCELINDNPDADYVCVAADSSVILISFGDLALLALIAGLYGIVTQLLLPAATGFSPGKAMVGLRIVNQDSFERAGVGANFLRWILWVVDSAPWCFPLVGLITGLSSNGHRRVGDMAAKTLVIDKKWVGRPLPVPGVNNVAPSMSPSLPATAPPFGSPAPPPPVGSTINVSAPPPPQPQSFPTAPPVAPPAPVTQPPPPSPAAAPSPPPPTPEPQPLHTAPPPPAPTAAAPAPIAPPATPPPSSEPVIIPDALPEPPVDATVAFEPAAPPASPEPPAPPAPPAPPTPPAPEPVAARPGVDAPQWDAERDTYIQWDPELSEWMEWSEAAGAWVRISQ